MRQALHAGRDAARAGESWRSNPHSGTADNPRERVLAVMWMQGYGLGNPVELPD